MNLSGYHQVEPFFGPKPPRSFVQDDPAGDRLRLTYFQRDADGALLATTWFGPGAEGPPGFAHGGAIASVLDEALGAAAWLAGYPVVMARLTIDMRELVPLGTEAVIETTVVSVEGRKVTCRAVLKNGDIVFAEAEGLCVTLKPGQIAALTAARG